MLYENRLKRAGLGALDRMTYVRESSRTTVGRVKCGGPQKGPFCFPSNIFGHRFALRSPIQEVLSAWRSRVTIERRVAEISWRLWWKSRPDTFRKNQILCRAGVPEPRLCVFFIEDGRVINVNGFPGSKSVTRRRHSAKTTKKLENNSFSKNGAIFLKRFKTSPFPHFSIINLYF